MSKVLVTGADGFIGSHLVENLVKSGHSVRAMAFYNSSNHWGWLESLDSHILNSVEVFCGDIRDPYGVRKAVQGTQKVFHLAALIAIPYSYHSPDMYVDTNIKGTLNILQAARDYNIERVIHTSTSEVYGTAQYVPIDESHPLIGQSPYSATKIAADQLALSFFKSFELPVVIVRPFNTFGPRQSARAIIPTIITQLLSGKPTLTLGDLRPTRDFTYVLDMAKGITAAGFTNISELLGEVINLGSNFEISIGELVKIISEIVDVNISMEQVQERIRPKNSEVFRLRANNEKALKLLNWSPEFGGIEGFKKSIQLCINWYKSSQNLSLYKPTLYNL
jgi:NAD dependent epimerase/dehydratase